MNIMDHIGALTAPDFLAVLAVLVLWSLSGWLIENPPAGRPSVSILMQSYRRDWMRQFVTAFFASTCMIAIGGGVALIGNSDRLRGLAEDLTLDADTLQVEVKIILALAFLANALLKFVWAHRLFGY